MSARDDPRVGVPGRLWPCVVTSSLPGDRDPAAATAGPPALSTDVRQLVAGDRLPSESTGQSTWCVTEEHAASRPPRNVTSGEPTELTNRCSALSLRAMLR